MQDLITVTGMIIKNIPVGEYDRHVCILTKERGKITAYAKGARKQNSRLLAATNPFSFGEFKMYATRTSYSLVEANIKNFFEELRIDYEAAYYGMYFMELADYYTRENNDEKEMLKLLYQSLRALSSLKLEHRLVRLIYEMKTMVVNGEFPGIPEDTALSESASYTIQYIMTSPIEKLYTFVLSEEVFEDLYKLNDYYMKTYIDRKMNSLAILETLTKKG